MACEACFATWTPSAKPYEARRSTRCLSTCSFPAVLKSSFSTPRRALSTSASKSKPAGLGKKKKKETKDDPWESLFQQLEIDLENDKDDLSEKEITEEDVANFEKELDMVVEELANAAQVGTTGELDAVLKADSKIMAKEDEQSDNRDQVGIKAKQVNEGVEDEDEGWADEHDDKGANMDEDEEVEEEDDEDVEEDEDTNDDFDDDFEEPRKIPLQQWQLRKLAAAVELGRRKIHVKSLAAELQLDRDDVLFFLKNPPPELLMVASEMDTERSKDHERVSDEDDNDDSPNDYPLVENSDAEQAVSPNNNVVGPLEANKMRTFGPRDWIKGKRIKKVNLATLQCVYKRTKWPTNAMIESVVQATHLPWRRVLEWFEDERAKSGTPSPPRHSSSSRKLWRRPITHSFERLQ